MSILYVLIVCFYLFISRRNQYSYLLHVYRALGLPVVSESTVSCDDVSPCYDSGLLQDTDEDNVEVGDEAIEVSSSSFNNAASVILPALQKLR